MNPEIEITNRFSMRMKFVEVILISSYCLLYGGFSVSVSISKTSYLNVNHLIMIIYIEYTCPGIDLISRREVCAMNVRVLVMAHKDCKDLPLTNTVEKNPKV